jgi:hypothetical protein
MSHFWLVVLLMALAALSMVAARASVLLDDED